MTRTTVVTTSLACLASRIAASAWAAPEAPGPLARSFDRIDLNSDGVIDLQEAGIAQKFRKQLEQRQQQPAAGGR